MCAYCSITIKGAVMPIGDSARAIEEGIRFEKFEKARKKKNAGDKTDFDEMKAESLAETKRLIAEMKAAALAEVETIKADAKKQATKIVAQANKNLEASEYRAAIAREVSRMQAETAPAVEAAIPARVEAETTPAIKSVAKVARERATAPAANRVDSNKQTSHADRWAKWRQDNPALPENPARKSRNKNARVAAIASRILGELLK